MLQIGSLSNFHSQDKRMAEGRDGKMIEWKKGKQEMCKKLFHLVACLSRQNVSLITQILPIQPQPLDVCPC